MISAKALPVVSRERPATCHNVSGFAIAVSFLARSYSILCLQKITTIQIDNSARKRERQSNTQGNLAHCCCGIRGLCHSCRLCNRMCTSCGCCGCSFSYKDSTSSFDSQLSSSLVSSSSSDW